MRPGPFSSKRPARAAGKVATLAVIAGALMASPALAQRPLGIDISAYQGDLSQANWNSVYANGKRFAFIRVTHYGAANGNPDTYYAQNFTRARAAGLIVGPYHFAIWSRTPQVEADYFLSYASPYITAGYLPPMLDLESKDNPAQPTGATSICDWARQWISIVKAHTGVDAGVYISGGYINTYAKAPSGCTCGGTCTCCLVSQPLWDADWCGNDVCTACGDMNTAQPEYGTPIWGNGNWKFWQYCSTGSVPGISGNCDLDIFNGTLAELQCFVIGGCSQPPVISNVQATNITTTGATITWTTDTASSSQVQYGLTASYGSSSPLDSTLVTSHSIAISGLNSKTLYHYRVISTNANGTTYSTDYTFTTSGPPVISNVQATNITAVSATITWTTDAPATSQINYGMTSGYGSQTPLDSTQVTSHSVVVTGLQASTTYHYQALSTNAYGSAQSTDYTFATTITIPDVIVDNTDSNCLVTGSWTTATSSNHYGSNYIWTSGVTGTTEASATAKVRWTPTLLTAGNYDVYVYYAAGSNRSTNTYWKVTNAGSTLTLRLNEQTQGNGWTLLASNVPFNAGSAGYVELMNNTGDTAVVQGDAVKFVFEGTIPDTQPPSVPANLTSTAITASSVQLTWDASIDNVGVSGYKVYRDNAFLANSTTTSYLAMGLAANTAYSFQVSAYDAAANESAKSVALSRTTLSVPPGAATVTSSATSICVGASVTWTAVGGFGPGKIAYYRYAWDPSATHTFTGSEPQWSSGTLSTSPTSAGTYYLHLQGYNSASVANGTYNAAITANALTAITQQPAAQDVCPGSTVQFTVAATGSGTLTYAWTKNGVPLSNGGHYSNVTTPTLTITNTASADAADYRCVVTGGCGSVTSSPVTLSLKTLVPADFNQDCAVDQADSDIFKACMTGPGVPYNHDALPLGCALTGDAQGIIAADFDADGDVDQSDFGALQRCFSGTGLEPDPNCGH